VRREKALCVSQVQVLSGELSGHPSRYRDGQKGNRLVEALDSVPVQYVGTTVTVQETATHDEIFQGTVCLPGMSRLPATPS